MLWDVQKAFYNLNRSSDFTKTIEFPPMFILTVSAPANEEKNS